MKITFDLKKEDMWAYGKYIAASSGRFKMKIFTNVLLFGIVILLYGYFSKFSVLKTLILETVLIAGYIYLQFKVLKTKVVGAYVSKGVYVGAHVLEVTEEGLIESLPSEKQDVHMWNEYIAIKENKDFIYTFFGENTANIIPIKAFASNSDKEQFVELVANQINNNKSLQNKKEKKW